MRLTIIPDGFPLEYRPFSDAFDTSVFLFLVLQKKKKKKNGNSSNLASQIPAFDRSEVKVHGYQLHKLQFVGNETTKRSRIKRININNQQIIRLLDQQ